MYVYKVLTDDVCIHVMHVAIYYIHTLTLHNLFSQNEITRLKSELEKVKEENKHLLVSCWSHIDV